MRRAQAITFGLLAIVAVSSIACSAKPVQVLLFNNTPRTIDTDLGFQRRAIPSGKAAILKGGFRPTFTISLPEGQASRYALSFPRYELRDFRDRKFFYDLLAFQLEPDGEIYAVSPKARFPMTPPSPQPGGFPLVPGSY